MDEAVELLTRARRGVLLAVAATPSEDAFASMVGLSLALEGFGKPTTTASPSHVPSSLRFLPGTSQVRETIEPSGALHLTVPLNGAQPRSVEWDIVNGALEIAILPERGKTLPDAPVNVRRNAFPWDCVITVGVPHLRVLGAPFAAHPDLFSTTPLLNIDHGTRNEFFGTVNLVPATSATIAEVVLELLDVLGGVNLLTPDVATCLLTGVVAGTSSFRSASTTPRTFEAAAQLVAQEADQQTIVRHLFQTHALSELRLLGRVLTRLQELPNTTGGEPDTAPLLLSVLTHQDFTETDASPDSAPHVFREFLERVGERRRAVLAFEREPGTLEALVALGRVSGEDRDVFRAEMRGALVGPWVLLNLGAVSPSEAASVVAEQIRPRLPFKETT